MVIVIHWREPCSVVERVVAVLWLDLLGYLSLLVLYFQLRVVVVGYQMQVFSPAFWCPRRLLW